MLSSNQAFLRLVRLGIGHSAEPLREPVDWNTMEALATKQGLLGVVLDGINCHTVGGQGTGTCPNLKNQRFAYLFPHSVLSWEGLYQRSGNGQFRSFMY